MIKISRDEAGYLSDHGVPYGEGGILHTWNKHRHYYLTESQKNLKLLFKYRQEQVIQ